MYDLLDIDTRELIEVVAGVKISDEYAMLEKGEADMEGGEKTYKVCKAWEDHRLRGIEEGRAEGMKQYLVKLVCKKT